MNEAAPGSDGLRPRGPTRSHLTLITTAPVKVGPLVGNCWHVSSSARCTGEVDVFEAASVLTNEFALADVALAPAQFRALFAGALRASR